MLKVERVSKFFGKKKALDEISFAAGKGEVVGFLGRNGAGKTTTMRIITGYLAPSQGKVRVGKYNPAQERLKAVKIIGYLPEGNPLYQEMKVYEYLNFIQKVKRKSSSSEFKRIIKICGIDRAAGHSIGELSRGFKQRVGLAASLVGNPKILILDEPTSGLDPLEQEKIHEFIKNLGREKTIILSTHILSEVEKMCSRVIIIDKGRIVYDGRVPKRKGSLEKKFREAVGRL